MSLSLRNGHCFFRPSQRPASYLHTALNIVRNVIPKIRPPIGYRDNRFLLSGFVAPFDMQAPDELGSFQSKLNKPVSVGFRNGPMAHGSKQPRESNLAD